MAGGLRLGITLAVLIGHGLVLLGLIQLWPQAVPMKVMATPLFTREIQASVPTPTAEITPQAQPQNIKKKSIFRQATPSKIAPILKAEAAPTESVPDSSSTTLAELKPTPAEPQVPSASTDATDASATSTSQASVGPTERVDTSAATASSALPKAPPPAADSWPPDTRLSYLVSGNYKGPIGGDAKVQWQREGANYQVRVDLELGLFLSWYMTSQGTVGSLGLDPTAYEEKPVGVKARRVGLSTEKIQLNDGTQVDRPAQAQDTASQFVELGHRFSTGRAQLAAGQSVELWLARPNRVYPWVYDVVGEETVHSQRLGDIPAFHLKPRPLEKASGTLTAEMWFAPSLQYLPVRIKLNIDANSWIDMVVEKIEQAGRPPDVPVKPQTVAPALIN